ncbi:hypothetical protein KAR10_01455, partial [bacterium]|nr:hypothetical protein [bacterium]
AQQDVMFVSFTGQDAYEAFETKAAGIIQKYFGEVVAKTIGKAAFSAQKPSPSKTYIPSSPDLVEEGTEASVPAAPDPEKSMLLTSQPARAPAGWEILPQDDDQLYFQALSGKLRPLDGGFKLDRPLKLEKASFGREDQPVVIFKLNDPGGLDANDLKFMEETLRITHRQARILLVVTGDEKLARRHAGKIKAAGQTLFQNQYPGQSVRVYQALENEQLRPIYNSRFSRWLPTLPEWDFLEYKAVKEAYAYLLQKAILVLGAGSILWILGSALGLDVMTASLGAFSITNITFQGSEKTDQLTGVPGSPIAQAGKLANEIRDRNPHFRLAQVNRVIEEIVAQGGKDEEWYRRLDLKQFLEQPENQYPKDSEKPLEHLIRSQAEFLCQAMVELIANGQDASIKGKKKVGRFGEGGVQSLGESERPEQTILLESSEDGKTGVRYVFWAQGTDFKFCYETVSQGEVPPGVRVTVNKDLNEKEIKQRISYVQRKVRANAMGAIKWARDWNSENRLNHPEEYNIVNTKDKLTVPPENEVLPVYIDINRHGYQTQDSGTGMGI